METTKLFIQTHKTNKWKYQPLLTHAYRVLLKRARQGMIIVVPEGDPLDKTRDNEKYDPTWNYLKEIGIDVI